jgi:hypothetical protein
MFLPRLDQLGFDDMLNTGVKCKHYIQPGSGFDVLLSESYQFFALAVFLRLAPTPHSDQLCIHAPLHAVQALAIAPNISQHMGRQRVVRVNPQLIILLLGKHRTGT